MGEDILANNYYCRLQSDKQSERAEDIGLVQMTNHHQDLDLDFLRQKLEGLLTTVLKDVDHKMSNMIDEVMQEIRQKELQTNEFNNFASRPKQTSRTWSNRLPQKHSTQPNGMKSKDNTDGRKKSLPDKVFVVRESFLTALLEVDHMKSIYNIFFTVVLVFLMNSVCYDYFVEGRVYFGLGTIKAGVANIHRVMGLWCLMHIPVLGLYYAMKMWATVRQSLMKNQSMQSMWSYTCVAGFIAIQTSLLYIGTIACFKFKLPYISGSVMLLETTRFIMKGHAFVRTNAGKIIDGKSKTDGEMVRSPVQLAPISCYLYFLFAPTLVYRDSYPRTKQIRWKFALNRFMEVVAVAFLYSYIYERHIHVHFGNYGIEKLTNASLIAKLFGMIMPGFIIFLCAFYLILHSWLNFTSELLRFGDRMFYKDWWTSSNYGTYYRNWNVVVHDFLYEYIYKDCYNHIFKGSKTASSMMVFLVSAYMHEHIIGFAFRMFYPVLFVFFGLLGVALVFISKGFPVRFGNIFLWFSLIFGTSLTISLYSMEYFARQNCPAVIATNWLDLFTPVSWVCNGKVER